METLRYRISDIRYLISVFVAVFSIQVCAAEAAPKLRVEGSNYVMYDIGNYINVQTEEEWWKEGNLHPTVAAFHLDKEKVKSQLLTMRAYGQNKLAIMIWYVPGTDTKLFKGHVIFVQNGQMQPQVEQNLKDLTRLIRETGYNEITIRFAPQGDADPTTWTEFKEDLYQNHFQFVMSAKKIVDAELGGKTHIKLRYDLSAEGGGLTGKITAKYPRGVADEFCRRLWKDYTTKAGVNDTLGFSIAMAPDRLTRLIAAYDSAGQRPETYAVDIYGHEKDQLKQIKKELDKLGDSEHELVVLETYAADKESYDQLVDGQKDTALNIKYLLQWPVKPGGKHFSMHYPEKTIHSPTLQ